MKYIAFCDVEQFNNENRSVAPSASNVVKYIADVLSEKEPVHIISPSRTLNKSGRYKGRTTAISDKVSLTQPPTFAASSSIMRILAIAYTRLWLFFYLLFTLSKNEKVVVYHSLFYMSTVTLLKKIKKLSVVLEIREIYSDINKVSEKTKKAEQAFFQIADGYIFATGILNEIINTQGKPHLIASGIYKPEQKFDESFSDDKIHIVYAGTLRPEKGGAESAIKMAQYLSDNYRVHILGYGSKQNIEDTKALIESINKTSQAQISYDGVLSGEEFLRFLQKCQIGVAIQNIQGAFNNTSFPSKVLTYLSNGLDVLSTNIKAVSESGVGEQLYYCDDNDPENIAKAVLSIPVDNVESKTQVLNALDEKLRKDIVDFL